KRLNRAVGDGFRLRRSIGEPRQINGRSWNSVAGERNAKIEPFDQRSAGHPLRCAIWISGGRLILVQRLSHARDFLRQPWTSVCSSAHCADRGCGQLEWRFRFRSISCRREELFRSEDGPQHFANVAIAGRIDGGHTIDKRSRRLITDKTPDEFRRNE